MPSLLLLVACLSPSGQPPAKGSSTSASYSTPTVTTPSPTTPDTAWITDTGGGGGGWLPNVTTWDTAGTEDSGVASGVACSPEPSPWLDTGDWPSTRDTAAVFLPDDHDGDGFDVLTDCDDHDPLVFPGAAERCDGVDTDCDPLTREDGLITLAGTTTTATIQQAIDLATDGDTILVCPGTYEEELVIDGKTLRLVGIGGAEATVLTSPQPLNSVNGVAITESDAALVGLTIEGFDLRFTAYLFPVLDGAAVGIGRCASGVLRRSVVRDNKGAQHGGGVGVDEGGELWLLDSEVRGNTVLADGGGISASEARVVVRDSVVADNACDEWGGGVYLRRGTLELERADINGNSAYEGGGLGIWNAEVSGHDVVLEGNTASGNGGAIDLQESDLQGTSWVLRGNSANRGGGVFLGSEFWYTAGASTVVLDGASVVESNDATEGGAVAAGFGEWTGGVLRDNTAVEGGAIFGVGGPACFYDVELVDNSAERGGAVALGESTIHLHDSVVTGSVATDVGDGAWLPDTETLGLYSIGTTWGGATAYPVGLGTPYLLADASVCNTWLCTEDVATPAGVGVTWLPQPAHLPNPQRVVASDRHIIAGDPDAGHAVAWHNDGTGWQLLGALDTPHRYSHYGRALALHGDTLVVGASAAMVDGWETGSVWVFAFDGTRWVEQVRLSPNGAAEDYGFGSSVAMSDDQLFVSATGYNLDPSGTLGGVYVFDRSASGPWPLVQLIPNPTMGEDYFGGVHVDGDTLLVAAAYDDDAGPDASGSVHVYDRGAGGWAWSTTLTASPPRNYGLYGQAAGLDGDLTAIMGVDGVDIWERSGGVWTRGATLPEAVGGGVAVSGTRVVAGQPERDSFGLGTGAIYVYDDLTGVTPPTVVAAPRRHMRDYLGTDLALIGDDQVVTVVPGGLSGGRQGQVVVFDLD